MSKYNWWYKWWMNYMKDDEKFCMCGCSGTWWNTKRILIKLKNKMTCQHS